MKNITFVLVLMLGSLISQAQILYQISGNGMRENSYLIGTYHLADGNFVKQIPGAENVFDMVEQVCGETSMIDMMNPDSIAAIQQSCYLPDGQTLKDVMTVDQFQKLDSFYKGLTGLSIENPMIWGQMGILSPSTLNQSLELMLCMIKENKQINIQNTIDTYFQTKAIENGKSVKGFETLKYQTNVLNNGTMERQVELLMCTIENPEATAKQLGQVIDAYYSQNLDEIEKAMNMENIEKCNPTQEETDVLINNRNREWIKQMPEMMNDKSTLFVVGAAHLYGENGLVSLLKAEGYKVEGIKK